MEHFGSAGTHGSVAAPRSFVLPAAVWFTLAAVSAVIGVAAGAPARDALVMPISFAFFGVLVAVHRYRERYVQQARADDWIARGHVDPEAWYGWRVAELTSARERRLLARSVRNVITDAAPGRMPGAIPLNRVAIRPNASLIGDLADRLEQDDPVDPRGVLVVRGLLTTPDSPLYAQPVFDDKRVSADSVASAVRGARRRLEVH
jgi:hypothetical protein